jgi:low temperature requirement protein LtrA
VTVNGIAGASRPDDGRTGRRWLRPPTLRTAEEDGSERRATWTELFFDLVFVVAVERSTKLLEDDLSPHGFWRFAAVLLLVVWCWSNFVLYTDRFDTDDVVHRLMKSAAMVAVAGVAVTAPSAAEGNLVGLVVSFLAVRAVLLAFYARAWRHVPEARNATTVYLVGFTAGPVLLASALVSHHPGLRGSSPRASRSRWRRPSPGGGRWERPPRTPSTSRSGSDSSR